MTDVNIYKRIVDVYRPLQQLVNVPFMIGGGCIGDLIAFGRVVKDFDFFFKSYEDMAVFEQRIVELGFKLVGENDMARQYTFLNLQFEVITWQVKPTAAEFAQSFDFTVAAAIIDGNDLYLHERTVSDCIHKVLMLTRPGQHVPYQHRIKRYVDKGYTVYPTSELYGILYNKPKIEPVDVNYGGIIHIDLSQF